MTTKETNEITDEYIEKLMVNEPADGEGEIIDGSEEADDTLDQALVHNSADKKQVEKGEQKLEQREIRDRQDIQWLLSDLRGRRFLWRMLERTQPFVGGFQGNNEFLQYTSGHRDIGKELFLCIMDADPAAFGKLMTEFKGEAHATTKRKRKRKER